MKVVDLDRVDMRTHEQSTAVMTLRHCYSSRFHVFSGHPCWALYRPSFIKAGFYSFTKWCKFLCKFVIVSITDEITVVQLYKHSNSWLSYVPMCNICFKWW